MIEAVVNFSFMAHFQEISKGVFDVRDLILFASTIYFFLFLTVEFTDRLSIRLSDIV